MPGTSPSLSTRVPAGKVNGLKRRRAPDDPALIEARRDHAAAQLEAHVRRIVDTAPPLSETQRNKIAALLRPTAGAA